MMHRYQALQTLAAAAGAACGLLAATGVAPQAAHAGTTELVAASPHTPALPQDTGDPRRFMHGIGTADAGNGRHWIFFSSSGLPPRGALPSGNWPHDVYVGEWRPGWTHMKHVHIFITRPEAQEPVSIAQNAQGDIFVTFEDGWNTPDEVSQRYGVYRRDLKPIKAYPNDVEPGGHSGHVATVGDRFVVFYSSDWVDGGGVDNLGTGKGVYVRTYDATGKELNHADVAPNVREWWPVVAGSARKALLIWQKYIPGSTNAVLEYALFDPVTARLEKFGELSKAIQYYVYSSVYVPAIDRFLVTTTTARGRGEAMLVDQDGHRTALLECLPATVRESGLVVDGTEAYLPTHDGRLLALTLSPDRIVVHGAQPAPIPWGITGTAGFPISSTKLHFVSLTPAGTREADFQTDRSQPLAGPADACTAGQ